MNLNIRNESAGDAAVIETLIAAAFQNAPHTSHTEQHIVHALRSAGMLTISLVAEENGVLVGHVAVSPVSISDGSAGWFGLGPLAVLPSHQRRGIGSRLLQEALRRLRESGALGCVVLGDPHYYGRFGFKADERLTLPNVPPEYFQAVIFTASDARGAVSYQAAFNA